MKVTIAAVGRLRQGAEFTLIDDYLGRAEASGRGMGLAAFDVTEIDERKARDRATQSARLIEAVPPGAFTVALDERGKTMASPAFADLIARTRDGGCGHMVFLIGGADGLDETARRAADTRLSLGPMVWPHMLVRVMLAEQLYRAVAILAGAPYHRA